MITPSVSKFVIGISFVLACVTCAIVVFWTVQASTSPIEFFGSFGVDSNEQRRDVFKPGDTLYAHRDFLQKRSIPAKVFRSIVDEDTHAVVKRYEIVGELYAVGEHHNSFAIQLPPDIQDGRYSYRVELVYPVNPLRPDIGVFLPPIYFTVKR